jgi:hypothetical protein
MKPQDMDIDDIDDRYTRRRVTRLGGFFPWTAVRDCYGALVEKGNNDGAADALLMRSERRDMANTTSTAIRRLPPLPSGYADLDDAKKTDFRENDKNWKQFKMKLEEPNIIQQLPENHEGPIQTATTREAHPLLSSSKIRIDPGVNSPTKIDGPADFIIKSRRVMFAGNGLSTDTGPVELFTQPPQQYQEHRYKSTHAVDQEATKEKSKQNDYIFKARMAETPAVQVYTLLRDYVNYADKRSTQAAEAANSTWTIPDSPLNLDSINAQLEKMRSVTLGKNKFAISQALDYYTLHRRAPHTPVLKKSSVDPSNPKTTLPMVPSRNRVLTAPRTPSTAIKYAKQVCTDALEKVNYRIVLEPLSENPPTEEELRTNQLVLQDMLVVNLGIGAVLLVLWVMWKMLWWFLKVVVWRVLVA